MPGAKDATEMKGAGRVILKGGRVVDPVAGIDEVRDVLIEEGVIRRVERSISPEKGDVVRNCDGLIVAPGFIDMHVHLREPGREDKETIETGGRAAAAGGFTAVACMPNTDPVNDDQSVTEFIVAQARRRSPVKVYPIGAITKGLKGISAAAEEVMIYRDILLAEMTGSRLHVPHISTARAVDLVRAAKARGVNVTCEATPHHFTLTDEAVCGYDTSTKMNPPLRPEEDRDAIIAGIADGTIDAIASDHAPHCTEEKEVEYDIAPFGVVGLETSVALGLDRLVAADHIDLKRFVEIYSTAPARILNVPGGSLSPGVAADVSIFSTTLETRVDPARFRSKGRNTPFVGWALKGAAMMTIVNGAIVHERETAAG